MPRENIGACGSPASMSDDDQQWFLTGLEMAILYIKRVCGPPPRGCNIEVTGQEHDLGLYHEISLTWEMGSLSDVEWKYLNRCQMTLLEYGSAINWDALNPDTVRKKYLKFEAEHEDGQF